MTETMEQYMSKTRTDYGLGVARPKIDNKDQLELKGQFLKEIRENMFSGSDNEDVNEHIEKVLKIVDLFHVPNITVDQLMFRVFHISLTRAASLLAKKRINWRTGCYTSTTEQSRKGDQEGEWKSLCYSSKMLKRLSKKWLNTLKKWLNGTSRGRSTETSDGLAAIQAQLKQL
ncbi:hypothetical protein Tco_0014754 [Tanacetum coccineum]